MTQTQDVRSIEPYKTSDTPFAAYLHMTGHTLVGSRQDPNDFKREVVVFIQSDDIKDLEEDWRRGRAQGDLRAYHRSLKIITRTVNDARRKREN